MRLAASPPLVDQPGGGPSVDLEVMGDLRRRNLLTDQAQDPLGLLEGVDNRADHVVPKTRELLRDVGRVLVAGLPPDPAVRSW